MAQPRPQVHILLLIYWFKMIRSYLLILFFLIASKQAFCQQIAIGTINLNDKIEMNDKSKRALKVAYLRTFGDGRKLDTFYIDKVGQVKYLILLGSKVNVKSKSAVSISIINNTVHLNVNSEMKTCSNGACNECNFFTENNKVVGVISVGDLVKSIIELQGSQIKFLETYINGHGV